MIRHVQNTHADFIMDVHGPLMEALHLCGVSHQRYVCVVCMYVCVLVVVVSIHDTHADIIIDLCMAAHEYVYACLCMYHYHIISYHITIGFNPLVPFEM